MKKYKLKKEGSMYRIIANINIPSYGVNKNDIGGLVETENNLSQVGGAWISGNAWILKPKEWLLIGPVGSRGAFLTITRDSKIKLRITARCFSGTLKEFEVSVKKEYPDKSHEYYAVIKLIKSMKHRFIQAQTKEKKI